MRKHKQTHTDTEMIRSMMFVPAHKEDLVIKATKSSADAIILDLEDSCPEAFKDEGRKNVEKYRNIHPKTFIRPSCAKDCDLASYGVLWPKAGEDIGDDLFNPFFNKELPESVRLFALVETAKGLIDLPYFIEDIDGVVFGNEDYSADTGIYDYSYARGMMVNYAKAYGIPAIDTVNVDVKNVDLLRQECQKGLHQGFEGKLCVHPSEIEVIHEFYTPAIESYAEAKKVIKLHKEALKKGNGVAIMDGIYIGPPMVKNAHRIIEKYECFEAR